MNRYKLIIIILMMLFLAACWHTPKPDHKPIFTNCTDQVNIEIKLNTEVTPSIPMLVDSKQSSVCIKSKGSVVWTRIGKNPYNGFTIIFKDQVKTIGSEHDKADFKASDTNLVVGHAYGIVMPDADVELDPIIIIVPTRF